MQCKPIQSGTYQRKAVQHVNRVCRDVRGMSGGHVSRPGAFPYLELSCNGDDPAIVHASVADVALTCEAS